MKILYFFLILYSFFEILESIRHIFINSLEKNNIYYFSKFSCFRGAVFRLFMTLMVFGALLSLVGHPVAAVGLAVLTGVLLIYGSGQKRGVLGEPLMFSDVAVIGAFIRHPRFYIGAIPLLGRVLVLVGLALLGFSFVILLFYDLLWFHTGYGLVTRLQGGGLFAAGWLCLDILGRTGLARRVLPVADLDVGEARYGLLATIILSWLRWRDDRRRKLPNWPQISAGDRTQAPLVVVVQCESFADPREFGLEEASTCKLPNLCQAEREGNVGKLQVSGFGAYTMRTEYGVLFGHEESELGFRRFDPYLTAGEQPDDALAARLFPVCDDRIFLHPHDLKFYGRDVLMPAMGFNRLIGTGEFTNAARSGVHIADQAVGDRILEMIDEAVSKPAGTFIFTVTIENHGPWSGGVADYLHHVRHGDELLGRVTQALGETDRDALLVFYGDHRPSLPGAVIPGGARHTPVVVRGFGALSTLPRLNGESLTPAALHHRIISLVAGRTIP